jgi:hypothetical protein
MAQSLRVVREQTPEQKLQRHLSELDDNKLACKAAGRHVIMPLVPGTMKDVTTRRAAGGAFQIVRYCLNCGVPVEITTQKGGYIARRTRRRYDYSQVPGYLAPKGAGASVGVYQDEMNERLAPAIRKAATGRAPRAVLWPRNSSSRRGTTGTCATASTLRRTRVSSSACAA